MKLDRNANLNEMGKYSLILNRKVTELQSTDVLMMLDRLHELGVIDHGIKMDDEFFVIRVRDKYASAALRAYANAARAEDPEYALEVDGIVCNAESHPARKRPD